MGGRASPLAAGRETGVECGRRERGGARKRERECELQTQGGVVNCRRAWRVWGAGEVLPPLPAELLITARRPAALRDDIRCAVKARRPALCTTAAAVSRSRKVGGRAAIKINVGNLPSSSRHILLHAVGGEKWSPMASQGTQPLQFQSRRRDVLDLLPFSPFWWLGRGRTSNQ